jgi:hypothetical protein
VDTDPVLPEDDQDEPSTLETVGTKEVDEADAFEQSRVGPDEEEYPHD